MTTPNSNIYSVITGSGSCIPEIIVKNADFANALFMNENGSIIELPGHEIVQKFEHITDIVQRRCAADNQVTSDLATIAGKEALEEAGFAPDEVGRIEGPIGLKAIGALEPAEIAVAILAELIMVRRGVALAKWKRPPA